MYDLIIIGGGPAGLTAAIYAIRKRLDVLLVSKDLGGKTNYQLDVPWLMEYDRTGFDVIRGHEVVDKFRGELEYLKFARRMELVERVEKSSEGFIVHTETGGELPTRAVILASGVRQKRLDVPGEKDFLLHGLGYSAVSYAPLFIEKRAVVIGDGDLALRSAAEMATVAQHVHLIGVDETALDAPLGKKLREAGNVTILERHEVTAFQGEGYAKLIVVRSPEGRETIIEADGFFIEMGLIPNSEMVAGLVKLDEQGRVVVDCASRTNVPGLFAAGDVTNIYAEQVLIAVGEGAKAALSAYEYLLPVL